MGDLLVLWDVDGTLLTAGGVGGDLYARVFSSLFGRPCERLAPMAGRTDRAIVLDTLTMAGIPEPRRHVDPFLEGLRSQAPLMSQAARRHVRALPGAAEAIAAVAAARAYQSVLTGNVRPLAEVKLNAVGLRRPLDLRIGAYGDDHEVRAELVHLARRRAAGAGRTSSCDFSGEATVVIGDTPLDVEAALAAGARAVGVATGGYPASTLDAAGAHAVLADLSNPAAVLAALLPS